jgi:hypothetical protein
MISVSDVLGGICNKTVEVDVAPANTDINQRLTQIDVYFNSTLLISDTE